MSSVGRFSLRAGDVLVTRWPQTRMTPLGALAVLCLALLSACRSTDPSTRSSEPEAEPGLTRVPSKSEPARTPEESGARPASSPSGGVLPDARGTLDRLENMLPAIEAIPVPPATKGDMVRGGVKPGKGLFVVSRDGVSR